MESSFKIETNSYGVNSETSSLVISDLSNSSIEMIESETEKDSNSNSRSVSLNSTEPDNIFLRTFHPNPSLDLRIPVETIPTWFGTTGNGSIHSIRHHKPPVRESAFAELNQKV